MDKEREREREREREKDCIFVDVLRAWCPAKTFNMHRTNLATLYYILLIYFTCEFVSLFQVLLLFLVNFDISSMVVQTSAAS